jgi:hypothetical protein
MAIPAGTLASTPLPCCNSGNTGRIVAKTNRNGCCAQRLEPLVALMLVRQRAAAGSAGSVRAALGAAVLSLPSQLLAMVAMALTQPWALMQQWVADAKRAELRAQTAVQLRVLCTQHGLCKAGAKAELVERLCAALCADGPKVA